VSGLVIEQPRCAISLIFKKSDSTREVWTAGGKGRNADKGCHDQQVIFWLVELSA
jgi:hypothetical protein